MEKVVETTDGRFHVRMSGEGDVTFVLDHGMMSCHHQWGWLSRRLAKIGRVFEYTRLGYGRSSRGRTKRLFVNQADELQRLLSFLEMSGPFVFVGHSLGAYIALEMSLRYEDETKLTVLLDPSHPDVDAHLPDWYERMQEIWNGFLYLLTHVRPIAWIVPDQIGARLFSELPLEERIPFWHALSRPSHWRGTLDEWRTVEENNALIDSKTSSVKTPVLVLSAGEWAGGLPEHWIKARLGEHIQEAHRSFAKSMPNGQFEVMEGLNHYTIAGFSDEGARSVSYAIERKLFFSKDESTSDE
ncbi:alpha/beta fold hydrolase [Exiguobacterium flavidum]|uniref:alpha/beta fold hydrolase n=1 Tax=Exiguobacterium flavidum TaxID=2184695 RepID=UPI000DF86A06|nr:alpha/beta hydrolase [Exiguobacterium flavidum]